MIDRVRKPPTWFVAMASVAALAAVASTVLDAGLSLPAYVLASCIVMLDGLDIGARLWLRHQAMRRRSFEAVPDGKPRPYAIVVAIHNMERDLDVLLDNLQAYREHVWIVDDASTDATASRLRASGWRYIRLPQNRKKPGAIVELLKQLPPEIDTVLVIDPDVTLPDNLAERIHVFQASGAAAMCPKITVRRDGALAEFQHIEYTLAFDLGRYSLSPHTVTSGVAVYDRAVLNTAMREHSMSVYGEDLENAISILGDGKDIVYDPQLILETEGKRTLPGWFSQRVGWSFSLFKVYAEHGRNIRRIIGRSPMGFYQFGVYMGGLGIVLWPLKLAGVFLLIYSGLNGIDELLSAGLIANNYLNHPAIFAACYCKYTIVTMAAYTIVSPPPSLTRGWLFMPFFFPYSILVVFPTLVGYTNWITLRLFGFRLYNDHYDATPILGRERHHV